MTVRHFVFFELYDPTEDNVDSLVAELRELSGRIDFIAAVAAGRDVSGRSEYHVGFSCDLANQDDIDRYSAHPAHVDVVERIVRPLCRRWTVVDAAVTDDVGNADPTDHASVCE